MRRVVAVVFVVAVAGIIVAHLGRTDPWAETLLRAEQVPDYEGVLVLTTFHRETFDTRIRLEHRAGETHAWLEGWRRGDEEWKTPSKPPEKEMRLPSRRRLVRPVLDGERAARNYRVTELVRETVALRPARVLNLVPTAEGRPSYQLWIDEASGAALGLEVRDPSGQPISRWKFESFRPTGEPAGPATSDRLTLDEAKAGRSLWVPTAPPPGYAFHGARVRPRDEGVTLSYTDGMNVISVTERNRPGDGWNLRKVISAEGKPVVHRWRWQSTRVVKVRLGETYITVVGTESPDALTAMVQSMQEHR